MKTKKLFSTIAILFIALISGCASDDFNEVVGVCPVVSSTNPINGAFGVPLNQVVTAVFNEEMNPATINQSSFIVSASGTPVAGTVTYSGSTATFTPSSRLGTNTLYTGTIKTLVKDVDGNALQTDYVWTFTTGLSPLVVSTDPANLAIDVALNKVITATFNMSMNPSTLNASTFTVKQGATTVLGAITYSGTMVSFTPVSPLAENKVYTCTITTGAANTVGTELASNYIWTFTTGLLPTVTSTDPTNNAPGVALNKTISATFSVPMNPLTLSATTYTVKQGTTSVLGTITYSGSTVTFTPSSPLTANKTYTGTITTGAKNVAGTALANDYVWNFTTATVTPPVVGSGVNLGTADRFGILSGVGVSNNAGFSEIRNMDVGISPGARSSITGFPPAIVVGGAIYASDDIAPPGTAAMLTQAKLDLTNAYLFAEGASYSAPITVSGDQGGKTLVAGIYKSTSTLLVQAGDLTLSGSSTDVWIFQVASAFTTVGGAGGNIILSGGAQAKNVFWQTGSSATIGDYTTFKGTILALQSITMGSHSTAEGRMLARNGAVVMTHTNIITKP